MISVVICSRNSKIKESLSNNLLATIGVENELIVIDNSQNKYSIFKAYNLGLLKSRGDIICFIHDDILLLTENWGQTLTEIFSKNKDVGLIGVAGTKSKTKMPSAWWNSPDENLCMNIIQHFSNEEKEHWERGFEKSTLEDVVAIDGVFMAARKINSISFHKDLEGFHNYDLNLSFEYLKSGYRIVVTKEILLEHFSIGILNKSWYESTLKIHKLYGDILPLNVSESLSLKKQEFKNGQKIILNLLKFKIKSPALYLWLKLILIKPVSKFHFIFIKTLFR